MSQSRRVPAQIHTPVFPVSVRGYDRRAVDVYVARVNRVIAELEATRSPQSAVDRALKRTEDERRGIIEEAREWAREVGATAQRAVEEMTARARAEAVDIVVNAGHEAERTKTEADEHVARTRIEAEGILIDARTEAADLLQGIQDEIKALRDEAEEWLRALRVDTDAIWGERRDLLDDVRHIAAEIRKTALESAGAGSDEGSAG